MKKTTKAKQTKNVAVAALSAALIVEDNKAPSEIQLTPAGFFKAKDGRPFELEDGWYIDQSVANRLIEWASYAKNDRVIDYEHQTLLKEQNGQSAPAAGWFTTFQWRPESGLWAIDVKWTPKAEKHILDGEYRYISPVIVFDKKTGHVIDVVMCAITNDPAIDGMQNLAKLTSETFQQLINSNTEEEHPVDLQKIIAALGLPENTTEEEALAALTKLNADNKESGQSVAALTAQVQELESKEPDPAKYVPIEVVDGLKSQMAALSNQTVESVVDKAIDDGKLTPAEKQWAVKLGESDMAALTARIDGATAIAALSGQQADTSHQRPNNKDQVALTADQKEIRDIFGHSDKDLAES